MAKSILTQLLAVSHHKDARGREALKYTPGLLAVSSAGSEVFFQKIRNWQTVHECIERVRDQMSDLIRRALVGQTIGDNQLGAAAANLSRHVLPECGFARVLPPGVHPYFDIVRDYASEIPWEVLEEFYLFCPKCKCRHIAPPRTGKAHPMKFCPVDGLELRRRGGPLTLSYHLTHFSRGTARFSDTGKEFLFIEDPTGDLCSRDKDPSGICKEHLPKVRALIEKQGYHPNVLPGGNATRNNVCEAIGNPDVVGIYYFGHGYFPRNGDEGCLVLADGPLWSDEIKEVGVAARFVFLNACEGAGTPDSWDLEQRSCSVAEVFARGGESVVIAPICPVVNYQAANTALDFFRNASQSSPLAEALLTARKTSYAQYKEGDPHISWMAYRYFGDPNKMLPVPTEPGGNIDGAGERARENRVFGEKDWLATKVFEFDIRSVLLRAAKRRNSQRRTLVSFNDFVAGMIRKGDLTRFILRRLNVNPDRTYKALCRQPELDPNPVTPPREPPDADGGKKDGKSDVTHADKIRQFLVRWIVRDKAEFSEGLVECLVRSDLEAQEQAGSNPCRISEREVLEALSCSDLWETLRGTLNGMPEGNRIRCELWDRPDGPAIDANGHLALLDLTSQAREVIEKAHVLAEQRGVCPITHRLMLAAMAAEKKGWPARALRVCGINHKRVFELMIEATEKKTSNSFGLSPETCARIVLPTLEEARRTAALRQDAVSQDVTDEDLFKAFCRKASPSFKKALKKSSLAVDFDKLETMDLDSETEGI